MAVGEQTLNGLRAATLADVDPDIARMRAALHSRGSRVVVFPDAYHGWDLLYITPYKDRVAAPIRGFLRR